jgi:hypothetical protein
LGKVDGVDITARKIHLEVRHVAEPMRLRVTSGGNERWELAICPTENIHGRLHTTRPQLETDNTKDTLDLARVGCIGFTFRERTRLTH